MPLNSRILSIIAGSLLALAFVLFTISNAIPLWRIQKIGNSYIKVGLRKFCISLGMEESCFPIPCSKKGDVDVILSCSKILAVEISFIFICIISVISALCFFIVALKNESINKKLLLTMKILVFICLIMGIIGVSSVIISTNGTKSGYRMNLGASAYLGIIAIIINLIAAIVAILIQ